MWFGNLLNETECHLDKLYYNVSLWFYDKRIPFKSHTVNLWPFIINVLQFGFFFSLFFFPFVMRLFCAAISFEMLKLWSLFRNVFLIFWHSYLLFVCPCVVVVSLSVCIFQFSGDFSFLLWFTSQFWMIAHDNLTNTITITKFAVHTHSQTWMVLWLQQVKHTKKKKCPTEWICVRGNWYERQMGTMVRAFIDTIYSHKKICWWFCTLPWNAFAFTFTFTFHVHILFRWTKKMDINTHATHAHAHSHIYTRSNQNHNNVYECCASHIIYHLVIQF